MIEVLKGAGGSAELVIKKGGGHPWMTIYEEVKIMADWFDQHLPIPGRVGRHFKRRNPIWGICWFHPDAKEAISRARYCAWLLEEGGLPVRTITTTHQREVIWRDAHQIVTKPSANLPKAFPERGSARRA